jgi:hypothetical protein
MLAPLDAKLFRCGCFNPFLFCVGWLVPVSMVVCSLGAVVLVAVVSVAVVLVAAVLVAVVFVVAVFAAA